MIHEHLSVENGRMDFGKVSEISVLRCAERRMAPDGSGAESYARSGHSAYSGFVKGRVVSPIGRRKMRLIRRMSFNMRLPTGNNCRHRRRMGVSTQISWRFIAARAAIDAVTESQHAFCGGGTGVGL